MRIDAALALALVPLLGACGAATATAPSRPQSASAASGLAQVRKPAAPTGMTAKVQMLPGLEGVIGENEPALVRQFGTPRLDVVEGDARKLQFAGEACVLDVYLYPQGPGGAPIATYTDARRASDGKDVDRAACVRALRGS